MEPYNHIHNHNLHGVQGTDKTMKDQAYHKVQESQFPSKAGVAPFRYYMQVKQSLQNRYQTKCQLELYETQISKEKVRLSNDYGVQQKGNGVTTIPDQQSIQNKILLNLCNDEYSAQTRKYIKQCHFPKEEHKIYIKLYNKLIKMRNHIEALQIINTHAQQALRSVDPQKMQRTLDQISNKPQSYAHQFLMMLIQMANRQYKEALKCMKSLNLTQQQTVVLGLIRESLVYSKIESINQKRSFQIISQENDFLTHSQYDMIQKYQIDTEFVIKFPQLNTWIEQLAKKPQSYKDIYLKLPRQLESGITKLVQQIKTVNETNESLKVVLQRLSTNKTLLLKQQSLLNPKIRQAYQTIKQKINRSDPTNPSAIKSTQTMCETYIYNQKVYIRQVLDSGLIDSECIDSYNPLQNGAELISASVNNLIEKMNSLRELTIKLAAFFDPQRQQQITKNEKQLKNSKGEWTLNLLTETCQTVESRIKVLSEQNKTLRNRIQQLYGDYDQVCGREKQLRDELQKQVEESQKRQVIIEALQKEKQSILQQGHQQQGRPSQNHTNQDNKDTYEAECERIKKLKNEIHSSQQILSNQKSFLKGLNVQWAKLFENSSTKAPELYKDQKQLWNSSVVNYEKNLLEIRLFVEGQLKQQQTIEGELHQSTDRLCRVVGKSQTTSESDKSNPHCPAFSIGAELKRLKSVLTSLETQTKQSTQEQPNKTIVSKFRKLYEADIFAGSEVLQHTSERVSVMEEIERVSGKRISKMNRLYRLDKRSKLSPHLYIDDKQDIVLLTRTEKDRIVGVYSSAPISKEPKHMEGETGFLFKIADVSKKFYGLLPKMNRLKYEPNHLIFGNSDIRVDISEKSMTSNFGIQKSHYNCEGESVNDFIGQGKLVRQAKLVTYEVYQVIFQGEEKESKSQAHTQVTDRESNSGREQKFLTKFNNEVSTKKHISAKITEDEQLQLERDFKDQIKQIVSLKEVINNLQDQVKRHTVTKRTLDLKISELQSSAVKDKQQAQRKLKKQRLIVESLKEEKGALSYQINCLLTTVQGLKKNIDDIQRDLLREKGLREGLENQIRNPNRPQSRQQQLDKEIVTLNQRIEMLEKDIQNKIKIEHQLQSTRQQLRKAEQQSSFLKQQAEARQRQIIGLSDELKEISEKLEQSNKQVCKNKVFMEQRNMEIESLQVRATSLMKKMNTNGTRNIDRFFVGEIIDSLEDDKKWLIENIESRLQKRMRRTRLLYRFDKLNKVNFHQYFDNHPNLLLIVKTLSGNLLGAFSVGACIQEQCATGYAFLYSLTNRMIFGENKKNKSYRAIIYDKYYAIFGNSQLRLKTFDNKVFSNFAIVNNYFETHGQNVDALFGQGPKQKEVEIETYEFYEIQFNG